MLRTQRTSLRFPIWAGIVSIVLLGIVRAGAQENYREWTYWQNLYLNTSSSGANVSSSVNDFPILVRLNASNFDFSQTLAGGADIRFAAADGTQLPYEIERWSDTKDSAEIWVKVPFISGSDNGQYIRMYWGNASASSASDGAAVFDTANGFEGVWHLDEAASGSGTANLYKDATGNARHGDDNVDATGKAGIVGQGQQFDRFSTQDYIQLHDSAHNIVDELTFMAWAYPDTLIDDPVNNRDLFIYYSYHQWPPHGYDIKTYNAEQCILQIGLEGPDWDWNHEAGVFIEDAWQQIAVTWKAGTNGDSGTVLFYRDGSLFGVDSCVTGNHEATGIEPTISKNGSTDAWHGNLDEIVESNVVRSSDWIKLCYENQRPNQTLVETEDYATWTDSIVITLNTTSSGANITSDIADFPVLLRLNAGNFSGFSVTEPGGADIRFVNKNGNPLPHEIERWDDTNDSAEVWVLVDSIYGNNSTQWIGMWYDKDGAVDRSDPTHVFDTANGFGMVLHLEEDGNTTTDGYVNSTVYDEDATGYNLTGSSDVNAVIGKGQELDGVDQYIKIANDPLPAAPAEGFAQSIWFRRHAGGSNQTVSERGWDDYVMRIHSDDSLEYSIRDATSGFTYSNYDPPTSQDQWYLAALEYNPADDTLRCYLDGSLVDAVKADFTSFDHGANEPVYIGMRNDGTSEPFNGVVDEYRIHAMARSADWYKLCYENQRPGDNLTSLGGLGCDSAQISSHPSDQTVWTGQSMSLTVSATGPGLSYQWQKGTTDLSDGGYLSGATAATLTIDSVAVGDGGSYRCIASNGCSADTSNSATVTVNQTAYVTADPSAQTRYTGDSVSFAVSAEGDGTLSYQWQQGGVNLSDGGYISGATSSYMTIDSVALGDAADYRCIVTNGGGSDTSAAAALTVYETVHITVDPASQTKYTGESVTFSVTAEGEATISYQWRKDGTNLFDDAHLSGTQSQSLTIDSVARADSGDYRCIVTNDGGSDTSAAATLTTYETANVTADPASQTKYTGQSVSFTIAAAGHTPLGYQWQKDGVDLSDSGHLSGATTGTLSIDSVALSDAGSYRCVVSNGGGSDTSGAATLTVNETVRIVSNPASASRLTGESVAFGVTVSGATPITYQWQKDKADVGDGVRVTGSASDTLRISGITLADSGSYRCVVSNGGGQDTSSAAILSVCDPPATPGDPSDVGVVQGQSATFRVTASGSGPLYYQWQRNDGASWYNLTSATADSYYISSTVLSDSGAQFRVVVDGQCGSADTSAGAILSVTRSCTAPSVSASPRDTTVIESTSATFRVTASGTNLAYQWQRTDGSGWSDISGASGASYIFTADLGDDGASYRCVITGECGLDTSNAAVLTVCEPPAIGAQPADTTVIQDSAAVFRVSATGTNPAYQWERDSGAGFVPVAGATNDTLELAVVSQATDDSARFRVAVTGDCGTVASSTALLTVCVPASIDSHPSNLTVDEGATATFSVSAGGSSLRYRWERAEPGTSVWDSVGDSSSYVLTATRPDNGARFRCVLSAACGTTLISNAAQLTVNDVVAPHPTTQLNLTALGPSDVDIRWAVPESDSADAYRVFVFYSTSAYPSFTATAKDTAVDLPVVDTSGERVSVLSGLSGQTKYFFTMWLTDSSGNVAPTDSDTVITTDQGGIANPLVVRGTRVDSTHVALRMDNFCSLPSTVDPFNSYAERVGIWYQPGSPLTTPDTAHATIFWIGLQDMKSKAGCTVQRTLDTTIAVEPLAPGGDSSYHFSVSVQWRNPDSIPPFLADNGTEVLMFDTAAPGNPCAVSGEYAGEGTDSAFVHIDSLGDVSTDTIGSVRLVCSFYSDFSNLFLDTTMALAAVLADTTDGRFTLLVHNDRFKGAVDTVYCGVELVGRNNVTSPRAVSAFAVGREAPANPITRLSARAVSPSQIIVSWNAVNVGEAVRLTWSTDTIPLGQIVSEDYLGTVTLPVSDTADTVVLPNAATWYSFGAQVRVGTLWSDVTPASRAADSTQPVDTTRKAVNSAEVDSVWFDSSVNAIVFTWSYDTAQDSIELGMTLGPGGIVAAESLITLLTRDTVRAQLGTEIIFDTTYVVALWMRKQGGPWAVPGNGNTGMVRTPSFTWEPVSYFEDTSRVRAFNDRVVLWSSGRWPVGLVSQDTIDVFRPDSSAAGLVAVSPGFAFRSKEGRPPFNVGLRYDSIPSGYGLSDVRMYAYTPQGYRLLENQRVDSGSGIVSVDTNLIDYPFILMVDTVPPSVTVLSDTLSAVRPDTSITYRLIAGDNTVSAWYTLLYAKGGAALVQRQSSELGARDDTLTLTIDSTVVKDDNGVMALLVVGDGVHRDTVNISRQVVRDHSPEVASEAGAWVPFRVTAVLDSPSVSHALSQLLDSDEAWHYDNTTFRLFRWFSHPTNASTPDWRWVEYNDTLATRFTPVPGRLMWLKAASPRVLDFGTGVTVSLKDTVAISLPPANWTDFALPWRFTMYLGDILDATGDSLPHLQFYRWAKDEKDRYSTRMIYAEKMPPGSEFRHRRTELSAEAFAGYSVYNSDTDTVVLRIPPVPRAISTVTEDSASLAKARGSSSSWLLRVVSKTREGGAHSPVVCGYTRGTGERTLFPASPTFAATGVRVYDRARDATFGHALAHRLNGGGVVFDLAFHNHGDRAYTTVYRIEGQQGLPAGMSVAVLNPASPKGLRKPTGGEQSVELEAGGSQHRLLLVGTESFQREFLGTINRGGFTLLPVYPNPFRSAVTIRFIVPYYGINRVSCRVYDARGRLIWWRHITGDLASGMNHLRWNGTLPGGEPATAGFYVVKITAYDRRRQSKGTRKTSVFYAP